MKGAEHNRLQRKLGHWVGSRMDAGVAGGLLGSLLSPRAVCVCDIALVGQERGLSSPAPMCCHFWDFLSNDEVLEHSGSSMMLVVSNLLHFIKFFSTNKIRWGSRVVWSVGISFDVRG